ncbi:hypothetical protein CCACVL1_01702 [Corchorus capsularis]|uniref:RNase H type-1 domain-containing protein n=1 Tax=Corchorus capsularis TaxID=210143 RepID=A0A1R3KGA2_COCAP|nr:hypothetical protein CCACVL1_01702 [Corchorus capsularis]
MDPNLGPNPSYVWRSIMEGRSVLKLGTRWRIGDGQSVSILNDTWVPGLPVERPNSMVPNVLDHGIVAELIDQEERTWKEELLRSLFDPNEVETIMDIPLSLQRIEDKLIWTESKLGVFTVRSAYHVAIIFLEREVTDMELRNLVLKLLWTANVIPKVKFFNWRPMHGFVPIRSILRSRHIEVEDECCVCGTVSLGFVVRNGMGDVVLGGISRVAGVESVLHAECMAIVFGMESAWEQGYNQVLVESDSMVAIEEIGKGKDSL